jgi:hypothetical protein
MWKRKRSMARGSPWRMEKRMRRGRERLQNSHGLEGSIYPLEVNSVVGMEEIKAYQKTRLLVVQEVEDEGPDGKAAVKNTTVSV